MAKIKLTKSAVDVAKPQAQAVELRPAKHLTHGEQYGGWKRVLKAASVPHVGTHGIRHRATTNIANSGVPTKVGMKLTGHARQWALCDAR